MGLTEYECELWEVQYLLDVNLMVPDIQRPLDNDKVTQIYNRLKNMYIENNVFFIHGLIMLAKINDTYFIYDGQHRYNAIKRFYNEYQAFGSSLNVWVSVATVSGAGDIQNLMMDLNNQTPLPNVDDKCKHKLLLAQSVSSYYTKLFDEYKLIRYKGKTIIRRPYMDLTMFIEDLAYVMTKLNINDEESMFKKINELYEEFSNETPTNLCKKFGLKITPKLHACIENKFILPLYAVAPQTCEYHYAWVPKLLKTSATPLIPKIKRQQVWEKYNGDVFATKCPCCDFNKITPFDFQIGHVHARANGGDDTIENMRPICAQCNNDMRTTNMMDYVKEHYPANHNKLFVS